MGQGRPGRTREPWVRGCPATLSGQSDLQLWIFRSQWQRGAHRRWGTGVPVSFSRRKKTKLEWNQEKSWLLQEKLQMKQRKIRKRRDFAQETCHLFATQQRFEGEGAWAPQLGGRTCSYECLERYGGFPKIGVPGTSKSSIFSIGWSITDHPAIGVPCLYGNPQTKHDGAHGIHDGLNCSSVKRGCVLARAKKTSEAGKEEGTPHLTHMSSEFKSWSAITGVQPCSTRVKKGSKDLPKYGWCHWEALTCRADISHVSTSIFWRRSSWSEDDDDDVSRSFPQNMWVYQHMRHPVNMWLSPKKIYKKIGDQEFYGVNQHFFFKGHPVIQYIMVHPILWVCQPIELSCAPLNSTCVCFAISGFSKNPAEKNTEFIITFPLPSAKQPWLAGRSITRMTCHLNGENLWKSSNYRMFHCYLWLPEGGPDWWEELRHLIEGLQAPSESRQAE